MPKLALQNEDGDFAPHDYGNRYFRQTSGQRQRLVIGASASNVELLCDLAKEFAEQKYFLLFVLLLSHSDRKVGRYQSPLVESHEELRQFLTKFREFLENDGRHHLWVGTPMSSDLLVFDQHDVVFAYGNLARFESVLLDRKLKPEKFWFPARHSHYYEPGQLHYEEQILAYFDWKHSQLLAGDEWPM